MTLGAIRPTLPRPRLTPEPRSVKGRLMWELRAEIRIRENLLRRLSARGSGPLPRDLRYEAERRGITRG